MIPFGWRAPDVRQTGVGRNCNLFRAGMVWAGREANARLDVLAALLIVNQRFAHPLPLSEVRATARSIEKYRERWTARGWHAPRWLARQATLARRAGIQSGIVRREAVLERDERLALKRARGESYRAKAGADFRGRKSRHEIHTDKRLTPRSEL